MAGAVRRCRHERWTGRRCGPVWRWRWKAAPATQWRMARSSRPTVARTTTWPRPKGGTARPADACSSGSGPRVLSAVDAPLADFLRRSGGRPGDRDYRPLCRGPRGRRTDTPRPGRRTGRLPGPIGAIGAAHDPDPRHLSGRGGHCRHRAVRYSDCPLPGL